MKGGLGFYQALLLAPAVVALAPGRKTIGQTIKQALARLIKE